MGFIFYLLILSFAAGILLSSFFTVGLYPILFFTLLSSAIFLYWLFLFRHQMRPSRVLLFFSLIIFCLSLGMFRYFLSDLHPGDPLLNQRVGESVVVTGVIVDEPDERESNVRYTVSFEKINTGGEELAVSSRAIITSDFYPAYNYGDRIKISGVLEKPENFQTDLGREFNYTGFLSKDKIYYQMFKPEVTFVASGEGNFLKEKIFALKRFFLQKMTAVIPEPEGALAGGLLLGTKRSLGAKNLDDFRRAGLIHIVVLSGYNITIVAESIIAFFSFFFAGTLASGLGIVSIVVFVIMTGAGATVVRASIMALMVVIARLFKRTYRIERALFLAGFLMLVHNPKILVFDPSFQLSFLATIALIYVAPLIERYFAFVSPKFNIREVVVATISTQIFVFPAILYMMGQLSVVALPVNLLVLAVIPITMLFGFLSGITGFLWHFLSVPFGFASYIFLSYIFIIVRTFAGLPFAALNVNWFPLWLAILIYLFYGAIIFWIHYKSAAPQSAERRSLPANLIKKEKPKNF